jgi:hypothetical protein
MAPDTDLIRPAQALDLHQRTLIDRPATRSHRGDRRNGGQYALGLPDDSARHGSLVKRHRIAPLPESDDCSPWTPVIPVCALAPGVGGIDGQRVDGADALSDRSVQGEELFTCSQSRDDLVGRRGYSSASASASASSLVAATSPDASSSGISLMSPMYGMCSD